MKLFSSAIKAALPLYLIRGCIVFANVLSLLILGVMLPLEEFGRFSFLWSVILTVTTIGALGGPSFLLREMSARQAGVDEGVTKSFATSLILLYPAVILAILLSLFIGAADWLSLYFSGVSVLDAAVICLAAYLNNIIFHLSNFLRVKGWLNLAMLLKDGATPFNLVFSGALAFALQKTSAFNVILFFVIISLLIIISISYIIYLNIKSEELFFQGKKSARYNVSYWWNSILGTLSAQVDILVAGFFVSSTTLGVYQIIKKFANLLSLPQVIGNWVVIVGVGKAYAGKDYDGIRLLCSKSLRLTVVPAFILGAVCFLVYPIIFGIYNIDVTFTVVFAYFVLIFSSMVNIMFGINFVVASQCHLEKYAVFGRLLSVCVFASFVVAAQNHINILSISIFFAFSAIFAQFFVWFFIRKHFNIDTSVFSLIVGANTTVKPES